MTKFSRKENTFTITDNKNGTYSVNCQNPNCTCLNFIGGSVYATSSHLYILLVSTLVSMPENNCKTLTFTITAK